MFFREWFGSTYLPSQNLKIEARYNKLKEAGKDLGMPVAEIRESKSTPGMFYQQYENGYIVGTERTGYWESMGETRSRWQALGFEGGKLGMPTSGIYSINNSAAQDYQGGKLICNQSHCSII